MNTPLANSETVSSVNRGGIPDAVWDTIDDLCAEQMLPLLSPDGADASFIGKIIELPGRQLSPDRLRAALQVLADVGRIARFHAVADHLRTLALDANYPHCQMAFEAFASINATAHALRESLPPSQVADIQAKVTKTSEAVRRKGILVFKDATLVE